MIKFCFVIDGMGWQMAMEWDEFSQFHKSCDDDSLDGNDSIIMYI